MDRVSHWTVDQLAANNLLAALKLEATPERLDLVTDHLAQHREDQISWAANRLQSRLIGLLEDISTRSFERHSDDFTQGFRYAEQQILTQDPRHLVDVSPKPARSQGQILRTMVRQARQA